MSHVFKVNESKFMLCSETYALFEFASSRTPYIHTETFKTNESGSF